MKKSNIKFCIFVLIFSALSFFMFGSKKQKHLNETAQIEKSQVTAVKNENNNTPDQSNGYIVKEYNGKVAAFERGSQKPFKATFTDVSDLPIADRELLKSGIKVNTQEELNSVLEDYCS